MAFVPKKFLKFRLGRGKPNVLIEALHSVPPQAEVFTDRIVGLVSEAADCHCIIATVSREVADLNRSPDSTNLAAVAEYRETIYELLQHSEALDDDGHVRSPFLHLSLHGMRDRSHMDIELGTVFGNSCSEDLLRWLLSDIRRWARCLRNGRLVPIIVDNQELFGEPVIASHRNGDQASGYAGYGHHFNSVQIEIARWLRDSHSDELVEFFAGLIKSFPPTST